TVASAANASPESGRQALTTMLDQVVGSTNTFISKAKAAGVPDVKDGDQVAAQALTALRQVKADMQKLRDEAAKLPVGSATEFLTATQDFSQKITTSFDNAGKALDKINSPELDQAGNDVP